MACFYLGKATRLDKPAAAVGFRRTAAALNRRMKYRSTIGAAAPSRLADERRQPAATLARVRDLKATAAGGTTRSTDRVAGTK